MSEFIIRNGLLEAYTGVGGDIVVPDEVTSYSSYAFARCKNINTITLSKNSKEFRRNIFSPSLLINGFYISPENKYMETKDGVLYSKGMKELVCMPSLRTGKFVFPESVETIRPGAFNLSSLSEVTINEGLKVLQNYSFFSCEKLMQINLPNSLRSISGGAFYKLPSLKSIVIPSGVTMHFNSIFSCQNLKELEIQESTPIDIRLLNYNSCINCVVSGSDVLVSDFDGHKKAICTGIVKRKYRGDEISSESWESVLEYVNRVKNRDVLKDVIYDYAFMLKFMVDEKFLSENMIDNLIGMANEQKDVERVSLFIDAKEELYPGSEKLDRMLKNMDADIKKQERKKKEQKRREEKKAILDAKRRDTTTEEYLNYNWSYLVYGEDEIVLTKYLGTDTIVDVPKTMCGFKVIGIANGTFSPLSGRREFLMNKLESVSLPDSVYLMGERVFYDCRNLKKVHLSPNLNTIPEFTFFRCIKLSSIDMPLSVTRIGKAAFFACYALPDMNMPNDLQFVGQNAFCCCYSFTKIVLPSSVEEIGTEAFSACTKLKSVSISPNMKVIPDRAFSKCGLLQEVTIPEGVKSIEGNPFASTLVTSLKVPSTLTDIPSNIRKKISIIK